MCMCEVCMCLATKSTLTLDQEELTGSNFGLKGSRRIIIFILNKLETSRQRQTDRRTFDPIGQYALEVNAREVIQT